MTLNAFHFHLSNVILYVILCNVLLLTFEIILQKPKYKEVAYLGTLLYTVHPVHTESVSALVGRADILSSILFLISFLLYRFVLIKNSNILFCIVIIIIAMAVLCKETAITAFVSFYLKNNFKNYKYDKIIFIGIFSCLRCFNHNSMQKNNFCSLEG